MLNLCNGAISLNRAEASLTDRRFRVSVCVCVGGGRGGGEVGVGS